jgi:hypothetical protein
MCEYNIDTTLSNDTSTVLYRSLCVQYLNNSLGIHSQAGYGTHCMCAFGM